MVAVHGRLVYAAGENESFFGPRWQIQSFESIESGAQQTRESIAFEKPGSTFP